MQHFIIICEMFVVDVHVESKETIKTSFGTKDFGHAGNHMVDWPNRSHFSQKKIMTVHWEIAKK